MVEKDGRSPLLSPQQDDDDGAAIPYARNLAGLHAAFPALILSHEPPDSSDAELHAGLRSPLRLKAVIQPGRVLELERSPHTVLFAPHHDEWCQEADDFEVAGEFAR